jgi:hypothetical protein
VASQNSSQATDGEAGRIQSIDELSARQDSMESKLDRILGAITGGGDSKGEPSDPAPAGGRPESVKDQVRAELERAEADRKQQEAEAAKQSEHESLKEQVARLAEVKPEPPQPRRQRAMWGKR